MSTYGIFLAANLACQAAIEPAHQQNQVYVFVLEEGLKVGGTSVSLPRPRLVDGQSAAEESAALRQAAGSERALDELFRNSVSAPFIIKVHDQKTPETTIRAADLWFVVHADLKEVDPAQEAARTDQKEVEAANMWFQTRLLKAEDLRAAGIPPPAGEPTANTWFGHLHARLLDRIDFEVTNRVQASRSAGSMVIASRTDPAFSKAAANANFWKSLAKPATPAGNGSAKPYPGGISYAKISPAVSRPGALLVELHMAFVEPTDWFQGAPILRSKFSVIAQDQIRALRRELARKKSQ
jgi:hypothetical protein